MSESIEAEQWPRADKPRLCFRAAQSFEARHLGMGSHLASGVPSGLMSPSAFAALIRTSLELQLLLPLMAKAAVETMEKKARSCHSRRKEEQAEPVAMRSYPRKPTNIPRRIGR